MPQRLARGEAGRILEHLDEGNVRRSALHFVAVSPRSESAALFGGVKKGGGEVGFADAWFAADHDERPAPGEGFIKGAFEFREFVFAANEPELFWPGGGSGRVEVAEVRTDCGHGGVAFGWLLGEQAADEEH